MKEYKTEYVIRKVKDRWVIWKFLRVFRNERFYMRDNNFSTWQEAIDYLNG